ncbi:MAG: hypothetical protein V3V33_14425 [Candidatus Lokiarchaeia archaeon]
MVWSKLQASDKFMCVMAIIGGVVALIESILHLIGFFEFWSFGLYTDIVAVVLAIIVILLGIKPIHYTPAILGVLGLFLIIFGSWIGGIIVLIAMLIGVLS